MEKKQKSTKRTRKVDDSKTTKKKASRTKKEPSFNNESLKKETKKKTKNDIKKAKQKVSKTKTVKKPVKRKTKEAKVDTHIKINEDIVPIEINDEHEDFNKEEPIYVYSEKEIKSRKIKVSLYNRKTRIRLALERYIFELKRKKIKFRYFIDDIKFRIKLYKTKKSSKKRINAIQQDYRRLTRSNIRFTKSILGKDYTTKPKEIKKEVEPISFVDEQRKPKVSLSQKLSDYYKRKSHKIKPQKKKPITTAYSLRKKRKGFDWRKSFTILKKCFIVLLICVVMAFTIHFIYTNIDKIDFNNKDSNDIDNNQSEIIENVEDLNIVYADDKYRSKALKAYEEAYNPDEFVGIITFESEIINEPIVQAKDNDYYLNIDYRTNEYSMGGTAFVDYNCDIYLDNNTVIYGHDYARSADPEQVLMFTPLHLLRDKQNYEDNKIIYFILRDRVETYEVCYVYDVAIIEDENGDQYLERGEPIYYINNYSENDFATYIESVEKKKMFDSEKTIEYGDKMLTLQTCYEEKIDKLIVLAKLVNTEYFKEPIK